MDTIARDTRTRETTDDTTPAPAERTHVGSIASSAHDLGHVRVDAAPGAVAVERRGQTLHLSPALARSLGGLLGRAADVAEQCLCIRTVAGGRVRNVACGIHRGGR